MPTPYDVIVVGARCAGSPAAMLLARKGYRVLVVDRATFPSDTVSTHFIHPPGVAVLKRWGLLDQLRATGCPPVTNYSFDFGPIRLSGSPRAVDGVVEAYGPRRRTVLDKLLVDAAAEAGAEVREQFTVQELVADDDGRITGIRGHDAGGSIVTEEARVVVGADGRYSMVAKAVQPEQYNEKPPLEGAYYTYWSNLPVAGFEAFIRPHHGWATIPTNDDLTLVVVGASHTLFDDYRQNVESTYLSTFDLAPDFAERIRGAKREARFAGTGDLPNFFRKPYGPGWALVGDAGYHKDPLTAFGITDAFRDVELLTDALDQSFSGARSFDDAMAEYQRRRDEATMEMFELTLQLAPLEPPPPESQQLFGAVSGNQAAMDDFASVMAGTLAPSAFFDPENVGRIFAEAAAGFDLTSVDDPAALGPVVQMGDCEVRVGTCSWTDKTLIKDAAWYPKKTMTAAERIRFYAAQFPVVEADSTYYRPPTTELTAGWAERTPDGFRMNVKAYSLMTGHPTNPETLWADIRDAIEEDAAGKRNVYPTHLPDDAVDAVWYRFADALRPLRDAGRLGAVLLQYPPWFTPKRDNREELKNARKRLGDTPIAVEFRSPLWFGKDDLDRTLGWLADHDLSLVDVDAPKVSKLPRLAAATADLAVIRFHGRADDTWKARTTSAAERFKYLYDKRELRPWVKRVEELAGEAREVHVLFNNCYQDYGVRNAQDMTEMLLRAAG